MYLNDFGRAFLRLLLSGMDSRLLLRTYENITHKKLDCLVHSNSHNKHTNTKGSDETYYSEQHYDLFLQAVPLRTHSYSHLFSLKALHKDSSTPPYMRSDLAHFSSSLHIAAGRLLKS